MLQLRDLHAGYGNLEVLKGVSLDVQEGEIVTLIGSNGAGKTTTLTAISGLLRPKHGRIIFDGKDITRAAPHEIVRRGLVHCPEGRQIFTRLTVAENLRLAAGHRRDRQAVARDMERVFDLFPILGERQQLLAGMLSGGEQQMLALGRSIMSAPRLLLLDEPSLGLAPLVVERIFQVIAELRRQGVTVLLVEQNAWYALRFADRAYVLETGTITVSAPASIVLNDPRVRAAYLGT